MKMIRIPVALCFSLFALEVSAALKLDTSQPSRLIDNDQAFESESALALTLPSANSFKIAAVNFITGNNQLDFGNVEFEDLTIQRCISGGYSQTSCLPSFIQTDLCPHNNSYFKTCCDPRYKYTPDECPYPSSLSTESCGGKFMCFCDRELFPVASCPEPKIATGNSCAEANGIFYQSCACPTIYDKTCSEPNQEGEGMPCDNKYFSCRCRDGYSLTCKENGPLIPTDFCLKEGVKYYNSCNSCSSDYRYDTSNCEGYLIGDSCGGKYKICEKPRLWSRTTLNYCCDKGAGKYPDKPWEFCAVDEFKCTESGSYGSYTGRFFCHKMSYYRGKRFVSLEACEAELPAFIAANQEEYEWGELGNTCDAAHVICPDELSSYENPLIE